ncbi:MAG TPA: hypothetical protein VEF76_02030 [Patescibacteria group bacterium]|nr:hypothetical protein [Patescibacteria group bacterium]
MTDQKKRKSKAKPEAAQEAAPTAPATEAPAAEAATFTGYRYLLDAKNKREYAIRFEDNVPQLPIGVFSTTLRDAAEIRAGETVFALGDEVEFSKDKETGRISAVATAYQIVQGDNGKPKRLEEQKVEFAVELGRSDQGDKMIFYTLTPDAKFTLQKGGFSDDFPEQFKQSLDPELAADLSVSYLPLALLRLPPQHDDGLATIARLETSSPQARTQPQPAAAEKTVTETAPAVTEAPPAPVVEKKLPPAPQAAQPVQKSAYGYSKSDAQTLVEKKDLGDGDTLKIIFNFEARRVSEAVLGPSGVAMESHKFENYDPAALGAAFNALQQLGGSPRPLEDAKLSVLAKPVAAASKDSPGRKRAAGVGAVKPKFGRKNQPK